MNIFSAAQLHEADSITTKKHEITFIELMERAGIQIFNWLDQRMQGAQVPIHIFCGIGNNGGDGLVVGRLLIEKGYNVHIYVANFTDKRSKGFLVNYDRVKNVSKKWPKLMTSEADFPKIDERDIIIDALFGIGLNRSPKGWVKQLIQYLNAQKAFKLSVDIPSGMYADAPITDKEAVLKANHTLTFQTPKLAFFLPESGPFVPYYEPIDIGLDPEYLFTTPPLATLISKPEAQPMYKQREKFSHKGSYGHTLVVAGSFGKMGAAVLTSKAALQTGAGLVTSYVPCCGVNILQSSFPEGMVVADRQEKYISEIKHRLKPTVIAVGPGIGTHKDTSAGLKRLLEETQAPMVIDADALNIIASELALLALIPNGSVLTPHSGELERLVGDWDNDYDKLDKVRAFSEEHKVIVVIKGAHTITVSGAQLYINNTGNPGMATAGSGDVLTGVISGLISQGYEPLAASLLGVYLHGRAGNLVAEEVGFEALKATDIIDTIGSAFIDLFAQEPPPQEEQKQ